MIKTTYPIKGMHCRACEITIGQHLEKVPGVVSASVSLRGKLATVESESQLDENDIAEAIRAAGYEIGSEVKPWISQNPADYKDFAIGVVIIGILGMFYSAFGLDKSLTTGSISRDGIGVALVTGLIAGLSTCMALVGGLVLGLSARHAERHPTATTFQKFRPHLYFNLSRIITFFILGGLIGSLGSLFQLQGLSLGILTIFVGVVMLGMGLQLTNLFPRFASGSLALPSGVAKLLGLKKHTGKEYSHKNAMTLGAISFFLPCGFTQVMQLYAISTGSFVMGALVMGLFAIGTAPGLLGVGGLTALIKSGSSGSGRFFKVAGVAVMGMAILNIGNGLNLTGIQLPRSTTPTAPTAQSQVTKPVSSSEPVLKTTFTLKGDISPSTFTVAQGGTYTLEVDSVDDGEGCMSTIMIPGLFDKPLLLESGRKQLLKFTADTPGTYKITCAMGIIRGTIEVI